MWLLKNVQSHVCLTSVSPNMSTGQHCVGENGQVRQPGEVITFLGRDQPSDGLGQSVQGRG